MDSEQLAQNALLQVDVLLGLLLGRVREGGAQLDRHIRTNWRFLGIYFNKRMVHCFDILRRPNAYSHGKQFVCLQEVFEKRRL